MAAKENESFTLTWTQIRYIGIGVLVLLLIGLIIYTYQDMFVSSSFSDGTEVSVTYYGTLADGTVFDTNIQERAQAAGIYNPQRPYEPLIFVLGQGKVVSGFEDAVRSLSVGETVTVTLQPEEAYGQPNSELLLSDLEKKVSMNKTTPIPRDVFEQSFGVDFHEGDTLPANLVGFPLRVVSINDIVLVETLLKVGDLVTLPGMSWTSEVISVSQDMIELEQHPEVGAIVVLPFGGGQQGVVTEVSNDVYTLDLNHPLAGQTLTFEITLVSAQEKA